MSFKYKKGRLTWSRNIKLKDSKYMTKKTKAKKKLIGK